MNWLDIVTIVLIVIPVFMGLKMGMIKIILSLAGVIAGVVLAGRYHAALAGRLTFIPQANLAELAAFAIIFVLAMLAAAVIARLLDRLASVVMLGWLNHLGGAFFGLVLGVIFCSAVLAIWARFLGGEGALAHSALARLLLDRFPLVLALLPGDFSGIRGFFQK